MRQYEGVANIGRLKDDEVRDAIRRIDRYLRQLSAIAGAIGPGQFTGGAGGGSIGGSTTPVTEYSDGQVVAVPVGGAILGWDGANVQAIKTDSAGNLQVVISDGTNTVNVYAEGETDATITGIATMWEDTGDTLRPVSATFPLPVQMPNEGQQTMANSISVAVASDQSTLPVEGEAAHDDSAANIKPVLGGLYGVDHGANPTAVAAGDLTRAMASRAGIPFVIGGHPNIITISASYAATQADVVIISASAGTKIILTSLALYADGGGTGPLDVQIGFHTATVQATKAIIDHPGLVKGSGVVLGNGSGIIAIGADDEDLRIDAIGFGTGDELTVCVSYYTVPA
jgi:hypothetical protein